MYRRNSITYRLSKQISRIIGHKKFSTEKKPAKTQFLSLRGIKILGIEKRQIVGSEWALKRWQFVVVYPRKMWARKQLDGQSLTNLGRCDYKYINTLCDWKYKVTEHLSQISTWTSHKWHFQTVNVIHRSKTNEAQNMVTTREKFSRQCQEDYCKTKHWGFRPCVEQLQTRQLPSQEMRPLLLCAS